MGKIVKVLLVLAIALVMCGCCRENADSSSASTILTDYSIIRIETIDSCEYLVEPSRMAHKGNCKYCAERRKKEQEELIHRLKGE